MSSSDAVVVVVVACCHVVGDVVLVLPTTISVISNISDCLGVLCGIRVCLLRVAQILTDAEDLSLIAAVEHAAYIFLFFGLLDTAG